MKLAIVHDFLNQFGGAERVVAALHETFPEAPIYTSIYAAARLPEIFRQMDIRTSFMQNIPWISQMYRYYFYLYPLAFEQLDLSDYEVILSSSSAYAKGVRKKPGQLHICYCHNPMRFVWRYDDYVRKENFHPLLKLALPYLLEPFKDWDRRNSDQVDYFIANSRVVAERIRQIYQRESVIINPPVEGTLFRPSALDRDYYLVISRLNAYKRIDLVVETFNKLALPLKIVGDGAQRRQLQRQAKENIEFLGRQDDTAVAQLLAECRAVIFPGEEDFGIVPLEAMAAGRPVIAFKAGGAVETIVDGVTGLFFEEQTAAALSQTVQRFQFTVFDKAKIRQQAQRYDKEIFKQRIKEYVDEKYQKKFAPL